jgi:hypothetical protein
MNLETRVYQALLKLYPRAFRQEYGEEMTRVFQENLKQEGSSFKLWIQTFADVFSSASREHFLGGQNMRNRNPIALIGGLAAVTYGFFVPAAVFIMKGATITITDSNYWLYWVLELFCAVVIPSIAIFASLKSISLAPTRIQQFGCLLSIAALVFSRWFVVVSIVPLVNLAVFRSLWIGPLTTIGLPAGLLLMVFGQVKHTGIYHQPPLSKLLIGIAAVLVLSFLSMNWLINNMLAADAQSWLIFVFCLIQLPWIGLGWLLLSSRQLHPQPRALT